ncbi:bifunctional methylenetetrahydrofolate dehydrogenase/methenyltetrahydrofolate cyclohydrolase FolD [Enterobacteriaceae endosymbiont of Macroplea mutica]|uniref:bifunctional methylenetetrahydrofolate dehydrogenase/methenyltetrahydrofolate cyclohydrolase FolD n=1 Tax=Enterobacteriaceae endosymbiont of Macroplea mutica TaxID=2675791 RepID=UPI001448E08E|nr:bifunctional methylenetetrahydrofolate dehydrogenase/methenyltetrahydrofolate cyclohydrolase FolD [Enterobacteriaceae endosymbiont of Macroplea mutica]QJC31063.1 bifunctional methylenetetrahydrofolate dehydrogenase/methenyltetrahydrofolate cyclohydrolase FolD [Enterobacteriaceae endosymbiont of Macroplea mutica]
MNAIIMDGHCFANTIYKKIHEKMLFIIKNNKQLPGLGVILVGNHDISKLYISKKLKICQKLGFIVYNYYFPNNIYEHTIIDTINILNHDNKIHGILIQLPLPKHLNITNVLEAIHPNKDIDGFHPYNIGRLCQRMPLLRSCTAIGIISLLKHYHIYIRGLHAVIIGASNIIGRPVALELLLLGCTVTITHRFTKNLQYHIANADLLIVAIGKPCFIKGKWIKHGAIIIDVGINRLQNNKIVGDVDFASTMSRASYITPVPGGIGPVTISMLMQNTFIAYEKIMINHKNNF